MAAKTDHSIPMPDGAFAIEQDFNGRVGQAPCDIDVYEADG